MGTIVSAGTPITLTLLAGQVLTVVADAQSSGRVWSFSNRLGDTPGLTAVAANATVTIGPFVRPTRYQVEALNGYLTYTADPADFITLTTALAGSDPEEQEALSETSGIAETIAGIEAQIAVLEGDDVVFGSPDGVAIASLAAKVETLDIPADSPLQAALASLVARLEGLVIPIDAGLQAAIASLVARIETLDIPADSPLQAAVVSLRGVLDAHDRDLAAGASERTAIVETMAGIEARLQVVEDDDDVVGAPDGVAIASLAARLEALDIPATDPLHAALASLVARLEALDIPVDSPLQASIASLRAALDALVTESNDADLNITETIAGIEAVLDTRGENAEVVLGSFLVLAGTAGTFGGAGISAVLPGAGRYRITATVRGRVIADAVGNAHSILARLFDATDVAAVANTERMVLLNANTTALEATATLSAVIVTTGARQIDLQVARSVITGTHRVESDASGRTVILWERLR